MENLIFFGVGILGYFFMRTLTGLKIMPLLQDMLTVFLHGAIKSADKLRDDTDHEFSRMSLDQKRKSKKYRYYCFVNEILAAFNLKDKGINVEGATLAVLLIIFAISVAISLITNTIWYVIILPVMLIPLTVAVIFLLSRMRVRKRKQELLDSMDILCSIMTDGFLKAVKESMSQFPENARPYFDKFLKNVELLNISLPDAVKILNNDVGSLYDEFCDSVITYEANRANGMETLFNFYISENAQTLERDRRIKRMSDSANIDYFASIGAIAVFGVFASTTLAGDSSSGNIWETVFGTIVLAGLLAAAVAIFIYIQYILSKPFIYTEKDK